MRGISCGQRNPEDWSEPDPLTLSQRDTVADVWATLTWSPSQRLSGDSSGLVELEGDHRFFQPVPYATVRPRLELKAIGSSTTPVCIRLDASTGSDDDSNR